MTTLTASQFLVSALERRDRPRSRLGAMLARWAARSGTASRPLRGLPDHLLRDIGLSRADLDL